MKAVIRIVEIENFVTLLRIPVDTRSLIPMISVYSISNLRKRPVNSISPYGGTYIIYYLCIRNQNSLIMETREYFEKVMQDYNQNRKGRSLHKYCKDDAVDYFFEKCWMC